jgi:hypothetical protein
VTASLPETLTIPARFNGPPGSANGGYTCGRVAQLVGAEEVEVSLRKPPPLDQPLEVVRDGERVELRDGDALVAEGQPTELLLDVPDPVDRDEVAAAEQRGRERWTADHPFPTCVVCGPERDADDGMRIFPADISGQDMLFGACWTPREQDGDGDGWVRPELVWAALDCPTSAPVANFAEGPPMVLASLAARLGCPVQVGESHTILSWRTEVDGRKRRSAAALYDSGGIFICGSQALWIQLRE